MSRAALLAVVVLLGACGSWGRVGSHPAPNEAETLTQILDLNSVYRRLGRLTGSAPMPFVAEVSFFAGRGDSAVAVIAVSLENRDLLFQKDGNHFQARYRVAVTAEPAGGGRPVESAKEQAANVSSFPETQRSDESILYQDGLTLSPGSWTISVEVTDRGGNKKSRASGQYTVPAFTAGTFSHPILTYQARGRSTREAPVAVILNPRGTIAYGGDTAVAYVEGYGYPGPSTVPVVLLDARDSIILRDSLQFHGGQPVESAIIRFSPDSAPLGELRIAVGTPPTSDTTVALVTFSQGWVVTNFDDMVALLRYFPGSPELDSLRKSPPTERGRLWRAFWKASDPNTSTAANEALDSYFSRLAVANARYRGEGVPGWRTDRGEVLIRLGDPDEVFDASPTSEGRLIRWGYTQLQLALYFVDETGFGRFRLTPASRAEFERVVARVSRQGD